MKVKKKNLINAWKQGCNNVKLVLQNLYPSMKFEPAKKPLKHKVGDEIQITVTIVEVEENDDLPYQISPNNNSKDLTWLSQQTLEG